MKRIAIISSACLFLFSIASTSEISKITLSELQEKADLIVLAKVIELEIYRDQDQVTIQVDSFLKGESDKSVFTFTLISRGGLKDFDPALNTGDTGVFFLKLKEKEGEFEKAYWGSIAIFDKDNFELSDSTVLLESLKI
ncbi:MAG: hypothetical protein Q7J16_04965 [Candidatus Cloacimonadales bacterium]|nr:hypothetical protein [Candidatus Cloacimonadales bacterium]